VKKDLMREGASISEKATFFNQQKGKQVAVLGSDRGGAGRGGKRKKEQSCRSLREKDIDGNRFHRGYRCSDFAIKMGEGGPRKTS